MELPLFDYYDMHLYGLVVNKKEEPELEEVEYSEPELFEAE